MIGIKDVTILDILPYTFKTDEYKALSHAIAALTSMFYETMSSVLFWADIDNARPEILDAMAAELDAPFYSTDMSTEQKRSIIAAAFIYNSRIGTRSAVEKLLEASFGSGKISEWFEHGGKPYHFKVEITRSPDTHADIENYKYFFKMLEKVKNKRSKLEDVTLFEEMKSNITAAAIIGRIRQNERIETEKTSNAVLNMSFCAGGMVIRSEQTETICTKQMDDLDISGTEYNGVKIIYDTSYMNIPG